MATLQELLQTIRESGNVPVAERDKRTYHNEDSAADRVSENPSLSSFNSIQNVSWCARSVFTFFSSVCRPSAGRRQVTGQRGRSADDLALEIEDVG